MDSLPSAFTAAEKIDYTFRPLLFRHNVISFDKQSYALIYGQMATFVTHQVDFIIKIRPKSRKSNC